MMRTPSSQMAFALALMTVLCFTPLSNATITSHRMNGQNAGETKTYSNLIYVHAIFAAVAFVFLIPAAIFASRFGRKLMGRGWFTTHAGLNLVAVCIFVSITFATGWTAATPDNLIHSHHKIGVIVFTLMFFQLIFGIIVWASHRTGNKNQTPRTKRSILDHGHMWFGRIVLLLAWAQMWDGLLFFGSPIVVYVLLAVTQGLIVITYVVLEFVVKDKSYMTPDPKYYSEKRSDSSVVQDA